MRKLIIKYYIVYARERERESERTCYLEIVNFVTFIGIDI